MSLNVLVIPEDFRKDQYVLGPLIRRLFAEIGKPRARVEVCADPLMGGIAQALDWERLDEVIDMYPIVHIFLLLVDRDGNAGRRDALNALENKAEQKLLQDRTLIGENAWQEIEVWALAGQADLPRDWNWRKIRAEIHPKETYFEPLLSRSPGSADSWTNPARAGPPWGGRQPKTTRGSGRAAKRILKHWKSDSKNGLKNTERE